MNRCASGIVAALMSLLPAEIGSAALARFDVTATVDLVTDPAGVLGGGVVVGQTLTGTLQYDLDLVDLDGQVDFGTYSAIPPGLNLIQGTNSVSGFFVTIDSMEIFVENDSFDLGGRDLVEFVASGDTSPSTLVHPSIDSVMTTVGLDDTSGAVFSSGALPASLVLADFDIAVVTIVALGPPPTGDTVYLIRAPITSLTSAVTAGDFDGDANVDGRDFLFWQRFLGDAATLATWEADFGLGVGPLVANNVVPEPTGALLVIFGLLGWTTRL